MGGKLPPFLLKETAVPPPLSPGQRRQRTVRASFVEKGLRRAAGVISAAYAQWELASRKGLLQRLDARVKLLFLLSFVVIVSLKREPMPELLIAGFVSVLAAATGLNLITFYRRVLFFTFVFGFLVGAPAALNAVVPGEVIFPLFTLPRSYDLWVYHIPQTVGLTRQGLMSVAMLTLRVANSLALSLLVLGTTPFPELIKALKVLRLPDLVLLILSLSYKYLFLFARTVEDMHLAKKGRLAGPEEDRQGREWAAGRMAFLFRKTRLRSEEAAKAMAARGFSDRVKLYGPGKLGPLDWAAGAFFGAAGCVVLLL